MVQESRPITRKDRRNYYKVVAACLKWEAVAWEGEHTLYNTVPVRMYLSKKKNIYYQAWWVSEHWWRHLDRLLERIDIWVAANPNNWLAN